MLLVLTVIRGHDVLYMNASKLLISVMAHCICHAYILPTVITKFSSGYVSIASRL